MKKIFCIVLLLTVIFPCFAFSSNNKDHRRKFHYNSFGYFYPYAGLSVHIGNGFSNDYYLHNLSYNPFYWDYNSYYYYQYNNDSENARKKIEKLEKRKDIENAVKKELAKIIVLKAKFYKQYTSNTAALSMAEITVDNGSRYSIKTIYFRGILKTHITNKLIIDETFSYETANILESSDRATYKIPLNTFGNWSKAKPPDMAIFDIVVEGIETPEGIIIQTGNFTSSDNKLLKKLKNEYGY